MMGLEGKKGIEAKKDKKRAKKRFFVVDVKKVSEKQNTVKVFVNNTSNAFVNAIRRASMNAVPTMAIDNVLIYENSSVMFDEMLCHRLAMLSIKTDLSTYKKGDKVKMVLEKEGPAMVYGKDIQSTEPAIEVIDKKVPIVKLAKGQRIKLELEAILGVGKDHSKWQPALISFNEVPSATILIKDQKEQKKFLSATKEGLFELKAGKIVLSDPINADIDLVEEAVKMAGNDSSLEFSDKAFVITVETYGGLEAFDILLEASNALGEKVKEFKEELKKV